MNIKKLLISIIIVLIITTVFYATKVYALSDIINDGNDFVSAGNAGAVNEAALKPVSDKIYNILLGIGIAVAVLIGAFLGIQFLYASVEGRAKIMEALVPYIVGCVVVFGAFTIWKFAVDTGNSISDEITPESAEERAHDEGLTCRTCGASLSIDASQEGLLLRGQHIPLTCPNGHRHTYP